MDKDTFSEGVEPGGLRSKKDIKVLICYIFCNIDNIGKQDVLSALQAKGLANYFEAGEAFSELVYGGNLSFDRSSKKYTLNKSGKMISDELYTSIPLSVREKALESVKLTLKKAKNEEENRLKIEKNNFGYDVIGSISGGEFDLLSFRLYVPDMDQAEKVKENFRKDPEAFYQTVLSILTRKREISNELKTKLSELMS